MAVPNYVQYFGSEIFVDKNGQCEILDAVLNVAASQTGSGFIAAVSGKRIRVLSGMAASIAASATTLTLLSDTNARHFINLPSNATADPTFLLPFNPAGWMDTGTGEAVKANTGAGAGVFSGLRYFYYTP